MAFLVPLFTAHSAPGSAERFSFVTWDRSLGVRRLRPPAAAGLAVQEASEATATEVAGLA